MKRPCREITVDPATVSPDAPLPLALAVEIAFPFGGMTVASLRNEARKGRLAIERMAGKDFVTLNAITEMRKKCLLAPKGPAYGSAPSDELQTDEPSPRRSGSSKVPDAKLAQDALRAKLRALKESSRTRC